MAEIGWIDFSRAQKEKITAVLDMLKPEGKVDELGIGMVRDALADKLFPGISTIQTRAKYFYIVPYILWHYFKLSAAQKRRKPLARFLEEKEKEIMYNLAEAYNRKEGFGVIGITKKRGESIARYPSAIYWNGLNNFCFIQYSNYSLGAYLNRFEKYEVDDESHYIPAGDDSQADDADNAFHNHMGIRAPYNENYEEITDLNLTSQEAEDFSRRIRTYSKSSLLAELLQNKELFDLCFRVTYSGREGFLAFAPQALDLIRNRQLSEVITVAHDFSLAMYGAHITYNQAIQNKMENQYAFEAEWQNWLQRIETGFLHFESLTPKTLYQIAPRMKPYTRKFINDWLLLIEAKDFSFAKRFSLIESQEYQNKKHKARLRHRNFDDCGKGLWLGFDYLDYRFGNAKTILNDIQSAQ